MMDKCETCVWYVYDEDYDDYICDMDLDEDELARFLAAIPDPVPIGAPATTISPRESNKTHPQAVLPGGCVPVPPKKTPPIGWCFLFSAVPRQASRLRRRSSAAVPV